jgi:hypothetical protein
LICKPAFGLKLQQKEKFRYITCSGLAQFELLGHFLDYPFITLLSYSSAHYYFSLTPLHGSGGFLYAIALIWLPRGLFCFRQRGVGKVWHEQGVY